VAKKTTEVHYYRHFCQVVTEWGVEARQESERIPFVKGERLTSFDPSLRTATISWWLNQNPANATKRAAFGHGIEFYETSLVGGRDYWSYCEEDYYDEYISGDPCTDFNFEEE